MGVKLYNETAIPLLTTNKIEQKNITFLKIHKTYKPPNLPML